MIVKCYAVLDTKVKDFHLSIFDLEDAGAVRQFSDAVNDEKTRWNRHAEDYVLYYVGEFDTQSGELKGDLPKNLVNGIIVKDLGKAPPAQMELFKSKEEKEPVVN